MPRLLHRDNVRGFRPRATCWTIALIGVATIASPLRGQPLTLFEREKAEWLLRNQYSCLGCHRLGTDGGMLAPSLTDVHARRDANYITSMVIDPARTQPGVAMPNVTMPFRDRSR